VQVDPVTRLLSFADARRVVDLLRSGRPAILPSDTGYMLSVPALDRKAVEQIFSIKSRAPSATVHIACGSPSMAERFAMFDAGSRQLLYDLLPGALSIVVPASVVLTTERVKLDGTVGIRIPANAGALQVITLLGEPVTATSLNPSGSPPIHDPTDAALAPLEWAGDVVAVVDDPRARIHDQPSTMVRVSRSGLSILRPGPISEDEILTSLRSAPA
jgi:L-threonylcarbamoyladenylate synthase